MADSKQQQIQTIKVSEIKRGHAIILDDGIPRKVVSAGVMVGSGFRGHRVKYMVKVQDGDKTVSKLLFGDENVQVVSL